MGYKRKLSYGGGTTKRRRVAIVRAAPKSRLVRATRNKSLLYRMRRKRRYPRIGRSAYMGLNQMPRMFVKMHNVISQTSISTIANFQALGLSLDMMNLQDPDAAVASQPFVQNFKEYALLYEKFRVHGVKITAYFSGLTANENDKFVSCFYAEPPSLDGSAPADPYTLGTTNDVSAFFQQRGIRKKTFIGTGASKSTSTTIHNAGYWSAKRIMTQHMDAYSTAGVVNADGTLALAPEAKPYIYHKLVSTGNTGFPDGETYFIRYKITFYVEWFSRRRFLEATRTEP